MSPEFTERKMRLVQKKTFEEIKAEKYPKFGEDINIHTQET